MILAPPKEAGRTAQETPATHSTTHIENSTPAGVGSQRWKLPPYGRKLLTLRDQGQAPALAVLITDRWEPEPVWVEHAPWVVVVPDGERATGFDFRFVAGLFVYITAADSNRANEIAVHVRRFHPRMVFSWSADDDRFTFQSGRAR